MDHGYMPDARKQNRIVEGQLYVLCRHPLTQPPGQDKPAVIIKNRGQIIPSQYTTLKKVKSVCHNSLTALVG